MKSKRIESLSIIKMVAKLSFASVFAMAGFFLAGCETTGGSAAAVETQETVTKGMTQAEVIAILGEPKELEEIMEDGVSAQIWRYEKKVVLDSTIESDGEQERSYYDDATGVLVTVREPIYRNEIVKGTLIAEILFVEGKVVALKEKQGAKEFSVSHGEE